MSKQIVAMFPGTFDPIHKGHLDIIKRAAKIFDRVIVVVSTNFYKPNASNIKERLVNVEKAIRKLHLKNVSVDCNKGLTVSFARKHNISVLVRSIRNSKDATYEIDMAKVNHSLNHKIETVLMLPNESLAKLSSTSIRYLKDVKKNK